MLLAVGSERYQPYQPTERPQELLTQANAILGQGQMSLAKYLWILDRGSADDPDPADVERFFQLMLERVDWQRDLHFQTRTTIDTLDYSGSGWNEGSKLVVAAAGPVRRTRPIALPSTSLDQSSPPSCLGWNRSTQSMRRASIPSGKVSIFVGGTPAMTLAAVMPLPEGMSEMTFAGALAGHRIPLLRDRQGYALYAEADFCIVGTVAPDELKPEGPFGDHLGYYSLQHPFPVLRVEQVYHRQGAIWPFTVVGRPPQEDSVFGQSIHKGAFRFLHCRNRGPRPTETGRPLW